MSTKKKKDKVIPTSRVTYASDSAKVSFASAMKQTGKSMGFLYRCINDGRLPAFKVARATVFRQSDIDKLMTPVPYTPTSERPWAKHVKPKVVAAKKTRRKPVSPKKAGKARKKAGEKRRDLKGQGLKASVAKALEGMTAETTGSN